MEKNIFNDKEFVNMYMSMLEDYDNSFVVNNFKKFIDNKLTILELGIGPALDYEALHQTYNITASDTSEVFIEMFNKKYNSTALNVCAKYINVEKSFDCIFTNKVLQVLNDEEMKESFINQHKTLNNDGIIFHCIWIDENEGEHESNVITTSKLKSFIDDLFEIQQLIPYSEMEENDSIILVAKKKRQ